MGVTAMEFFRTGRGVLVWGASGSLKEDSTAGGRSRGRGDSRGGVWGVSEVFEGSGGRERGGVARVRKGAKARDERAMRVVK